MLTCGNCSLHWAMSESWIWSQKLRSSSWSSGKSHRNLRQPHRHCFTAGNYLVIVNWNLVSSVLRDRNSLDKILDKLNCTWLFRELTWKTIETPAITLLMWYCECILYFFKNQLRVTHFMHTRRFSGLLLLPFDWGPEFNTQLPWHWDVFLINKGL